MTVYHALTDVYKYANYPQRLSWETTWTHLNSSASPSLSATMALSGTINYITNPIVAYFPVILNDSPPTQGFVPLDGCTISATYWTRISGVDGTYQKQNPVTTTNAGEGSFTLPPAPPLVEYVALLVECPLPVYRTGVVPWEYLYGMPLDIFFYLDQQPVTSGITAGNISTLISGGGLPGNTMITAGSSVGNSGGLSFTGSEGQVSLSFDVALAPDTSDQLSQLIDLTVVSDDVSVGFPTDLFKSATDVVNSIKSGITAAQASMQPAILNATAQALSGLAHITFERALQFVNDEVSITFGRITYPNQYTWGIGGTKDTTVVVNAIVSVGYPWLYFPNTNT